MMVVLSFFQSDRNGTSGIYITSVDGNDWERFVNNFVSVPKMSVGAENNYSVSYALSPDGGRIVFQSNRDGNSEIYVMSTDGGNVVRLTDNSASDKYPRWSPDGKKILFQSDRDGSYGLYVVNSDGGNLKNLVGNTADSSFTWSSSSLWLKLNMFTRWGDNLFKRVKAMYPIDDSRK